MTSGELELPRLSLRNSLPVVLVCSCGLSPAVERAYDGHVVDGRFIEPQGYAAFLRGASAEATGDVKGALVAYAEAARIDPRGTEIWTRIGAVRCQADPRDAQVDASFARALKLDATYAPAWAAKAKCALLRGDTVVARAAAQRAAELDSTADGANILLARTAPPAQAGATRVALVALTVTARDPIVAWDALATWAEAHGDVALWARALEEGVRFAPARREDVARAAELLAGVGETWVARRVAAAAVDADWSPLAGDHPLAARLALDEAIARGDGEAVSRRATRARLSLDEVAGRAFLGGNRSLARELALAIAGADPAAIGPQWVLAASIGGDIMGAPREARTHGEVPSAAAFVVFGSALVHVASPEQSRAMLDGVMHDPIVAGDDLVVRPAVQLASRGVISVEALPGDGVVELAALRGLAPAEHLQAPNAHVLDARHEYLALALAYPQGERAKELGARLASVATFDPIVAAAAALMQLAASEATAAGTARALLARNVGDPLCAEVAMRLAEKVGDNDTARRAREVLTALGDGLRTWVE